jgi:hypothetical protein
MADVPSAAAYRPKSLLGSGPKVSLKGKHPPPVDRTPGPGAYEVRKAHEALEPRVGVAWKLEVGRPVEVEVVPGPSDYVSKRSASTGPAFTMRRNHVPFKGKAFLLVAVH